MTILGLSSGFSHDGADAHAGRIGHAGGLSVKFGLGLFKALGEQTLMVGAMVLAFLILRRFAFRAPTVGALLAGLAVAFARNELHFNDVHLALAVPLWTWPEFSLGAVLGLNLPSSSWRWSRRTRRASPSSTPPATMPAIDFHHRHRHPLAADAPFGGHGINLAVLTAAIVTSPEPTPTTTAATPPASPCGCCYLLTGLFGATAVGIFAGLPKALIAAVAGLALLGARPPTPSPAPCANPTPAKAP
ncbi:MAG: benzoate/H(+) symporter BenE family transporter [Thermomicrobiales bacterium]